MEPKYEQQYRQQARTHPIAYLAQTPPQVTQYAPESGAHGDQSQDH